MVPHGLTVLMCTTEGTTALTLARPSGPMTAIAELVVPRSIPMLVLLEPHGLRREHVDTGAFRIVSR